MNPGIAPRLNHNQAQQGEAKLTKKPDKEVLTRPTAPPSRGVLSGIQAGKTLGNDGKPRKSAPKPAPKGKAKR